MKDSFLEKNGLYVFAAIFFVLVFFKKTMISNINTVLILLFAGTLLFSIHYFVKNYSRIKKQFKVSRRTLLILHGIIIISISLRFIVPFAHTFYPDDFWMMEQSKNLMLKGDPVNCFYDLEFEEQCSSIKPIGYPILLSIPSLMLGYSNHVMLLFNSILSIFVIYLFFLVVLKLFNDERIALWASFLLTVSTRFTVTSNHIDNVIPGLLFVLLAVLFYILYTKTSRFNSLAIAFLFLSIIVRFEYVFLVLLPIIIYGNKLLRSQSERKKTVVNFLFIVLFVYIGLLQINAFDVSKVNLNDDGPLSFNYNVAFDNIQYNILTLFEFWGIVYVIVVLVLGVIGFAASIKSNKKHLVSLITVLPITFFYLIVRSPHLKETIVLVFMFLIAYASYLLSEFLLKKIGRKIILLIVLFFLLFGFSSAWEIGGLIGKNDVMMLEKQAMNWMSQLPIPNNCFVVAERPSHIASSLGVKSIRYWDVYSDSGYLEQNINENCLLFYQDRFCYEKRDGWLAPDIEEIFLDSPLRCQELREKMYLESLWMIERNGIQFKLMNITGVRG